MRPRAALLPSARSAEWKSSEAVVAKLNRFVTLSDEDRSAVEALCWNTRRVAAQRDIISEGSRPVGVHVILEGWACRYKTLRDGSRHIPAFLLPGDFCDLQAPMLDRMDHGIAAITPVKVATVSHAQMAASALDRPNVMLALHWVTLVDLAVLRTWMVGLSGRSALGRVAHMICELRDRSASVGIGDREEFPFPLTQVELADATGQTAVHANRIVSQLRSSGLADIRNGTVTIINPIALEAAAEYDSNYLHQEQAARGHNAS